MTQKDKELLLKDLCARLAYGVTYYHDTYNVVTPKQILGLTEINNILLGIGDNIKPYLRPMSSMTEEEFFEYRRIKFSKVTYREEYKRIDVGKYHNVGIIPIDEYLDWLNAHHFDYRGLIEKGLALEAPEDMYNTK